MMTVTADALRKRINRKLAHDERYLAYFYGQVNGSYGIVDAEINGVVGSLMDLEDWGRSLEVLRGNESLAS